MNMGSSPIVIGNIVDSKDISTRAYVNNDESNRMRFGTIDWIRLIHEIDRDRYHRLDEIDRMKSIG